MKPRLLILGAGHFYVDTIRKVRDAGFTVFTVDRDPAAPGYKFSDDYAVIDLVDKDKIFNYALRQNVDGIMPINDFGTRASFYACQKLNLLGPTYLAGICGNDKGIMRDIWNHEGLPQPTYYVFAPADSSSKITRRVNLPMVVKPTDCGGGGRGISIVRDLQEIEEAISHARLFAKNQRLIAEEFMEGTEVTVDSLVYKGEVYPLAISDKVKPKSRYPVATSLNYPAAFPGEVIERIKKLVIQASESMGISNGSTHCELIVSRDEGDIRLVEIGIRGGGGHIFSTIIEEVTGVCGPVQLARILCGLEPKLEILRNSGCVYRFFNPVGRGVIRLIHYDEDVLKRPFVVAFGLMAKSGHFYGGLSDDLKRVGYVVTRGIDRYEAVRNADIVESAVHFEFDEGGI